MDLISCLWKFILFFGLGSIVLGKLQPIAPDVLLVKKGGSILLDCKLDNVKHCIWSTSYSTSAEVPGVIDSEPVRLLSYTDGLNECGLVILYVLDMDVGEWHCTEKSSNRTFVIDIIVESDDVFEIPFEDNGKPNGTEIEIGKPFNMSCHIHLPLSTCVWNTPYGVVIPSYPAGWNPDSRRLIPTFDSPRRCGLHILSTVDADNGVWTCSVSADKHGHNRVCEIGQAVITISKAPQSISFDQAEVNVVQNTDFLVICAVKHSRPKPQQLLWYIDDTLIEDPRIVHTSQTVDAEGYANYSEIVMLKGNKSTNGKVLRCMYRHDAHHPGKDINETKLTIYIQGTNPESMSHVILAAAFVGGGVCGCLLSLLIVIALKCKSRLQSRSEPTTVKEEHEYLVNDDESQPAA